MYRVLPSNDDNDGNANVILKYNFSFLELFRDYSNLFNVKNAGELSRAQLTVNDVKAKKTKEKLAVMRSCSRDNLKFGHFTLLFCRGR